MHPQTDDLCQERTCEPGSHQLAVGSTEGWFIQALSNQLAGKLIVLQFEVRWPMRIWVNEGLLVIWETCEQSIPCIKQCRTCQFKPFSPHTSPIQTYRDSHTYLTCWGNVLHCQHNIQAVFNLLGQNWIYDRGHQTEQFDITILYPIQSKFDPDLNKYMWFW